MDELKAKFLTGLELFGIAYEKSAEKSASLGTEFRIINYDPFRLQHYIQLMNGMVTFTGTGASFSVSVPVNVSLGVHGRVSGTVNHMGEVAIHLNGYVVLSKDNNAIVVEDKKKAIALAKDKKFGEIV